MQKTKDSQTNTTALARPSSRRPSRRYNSRPATRDNSRSPNRGRVLQESQQKSSSQAVQVTPAQITGKGEALHHTSTRLVTLHTSFQRPCTAEGQLITDRASDGHTSFHTTLQIDTKQGAKSIPVKVDPGAEVNTIPLS